MIKLPYLHRFRKKNHTTTVVPTKSDSDVIVCLQLLSETFTCTLHFCLHESIDHLPLNPADTINTQVIYLFEVLDNFVNKTLRHYLFWLAGQYTLAMSIVYFGQQAKIVFNILILTSKNKLNESTCTFLFTSEKKTDALETDKGRPEKQSTFFC